MEKFKSENHYDNFSTTFERICGANFHVGFYQEPNVSVLQANKTLTDQMADFIELKANENVLDIGCGIGGPARQLAEKYQVKVLGISNSEKGISTAQATKRPAVSFRVMDAMNLSALEKDDFDVAWLMESSHLMADKALLFKNIAEITHLSGRFVLCDFFLKSKNDTLNKSHLYKMRKIFKAFGKLKLLDVNEYQQTAKSVGFNHVVIEDISNFVEPTFMHWAKEAENHKQTSTEFADFLVAAECLGDLFRENVLSYKLIKGQK